MTMPLAVASRRLGLMVTGASHYGGDRRGHVGRAAENRVESGGKLARRTGLGNVVVGAELEADDAVDGIALGGEHENGKLALFANAFENLHAAHAGHHHVEHDDFKFLS